MAVLAPGTIDLRHINALNAARAKSLSAPSQRPLCLIESRYVCAGSAKCLPGDEDRAHQDRVAWPNKKFLTDRFGRATGRAVAALAHSINIADTGNLQRLIT